MFHSDFFSFSVLQYHPTDFLRRLSLVSVATCWEDFPKLYLLYLELVDLSIAPCLARIFEIFAFAFDVLVV